PVCIGVPHWSGAPISPLRTVAERDRRSSRRAPSALPHPTSGGRPPNDPALHRFSGYPRRVRLGEAKLKTFASSTQVHAATERRMTGFFWKASPAPANLGASEYSHPRLRTTQADRASGPPPG